MFFNCDIVYILKSDKKILKNIALLSLL